MLIRLRDMETAGEQLRGSSREYTASELRVKLADAASEVETMVTNQLRSDPTKLGEVTDHLIDLPSVQHLTRAGGFRDTFVGIAMESCLRGFNLDQPSHFASSPRDWKKAFDRVKPADEIASAELEQSRAKELISHIAATLGVDTKTIQGRQAVGDELRRSLSLL